MRIRFTIRDLLWLTVVVALAVAWRVDRMRWQDDWNSAHAQLIEQNMELNAKFEACKVREKAAGIWPIAAP